MKNYYCMIDNKVSPKNPDYGFANTKDIAVFNSKSERDSFVRSRAHFDLSCTAISAKEASAYRIEDSEGGKGAYTREGEFIVFGKQTEFYDLRH